MIRALYITFLTSIVLAYMATPAQASTQASEPWFVEVWEPDGSVVTTVFSEFPAAWDYAGQQADLHPEAIDVDVGPLSKSVALGFESATPGEQTDYTASEQTKMANSAMHYEGDTLVVPVDAISEQERTTLLALGFYGDPNDGREALYPPKGTEECWNIHPDKPVFSFTGTCYESFNKLPATVRQQMFLTGHTESLPANLKWSGYTVVPVSSLGYPSKSLR